MSRPKVAPTDDFNVKIEIPPGWSVNLNAVRRLLASTCLKVWFN